MSAILGRIHFNSSPVNTVAFNNAFEIISNYGGNRSNTWVGNDIALGQHLLEVTPESRHEKLPYCWQEAVIVADARIDNRNELCDYFQIPNVDRRTTPDSYLILKAYRYWGEDCTAHLLGDFAFAIWDKQRKQLFCARDHIGARPFYYYYISSTFIFSTDIRALKAFSDVDITLDDFEIAQYLVWPQFPKNKTFFKHIHILQFGRQLVVDGHSLRHRTHWQPEDAPDVRYKNTADYVDHFRELLEKSVADRVRTDYPVGSHVSGGIDSSGVTVLANLELRKTGRSLDMTYTWSPARSEAYPSVQGDERDLIEALCDQENLSCHYGSATAQDYRHFLTRDIAVEFSADLFEELPVMVHASQRNIRVMLSGWGGDEAASFSGSGYLAYLLKNGRLAHLLKITRRHTKGLRQIGLVQRFLYRNAVIPLLPNWIYKNVDPLYRPDRSLNYIDSLFAIQVLGEKFDGGRDRFRLSGNPHKIQCQLINSGHITERMMTWANWSSSHQIIYSYPLTDKRILDFALGLSPDLLYQSGQWRYMFQAALKDLLSFKTYRTNKRDLTNEEKRAVNRLNCWKLLAADLTTDRLPHSKVTWVNSELLSESLKQVPEKMEKSETLDFVSLTRAIRICYLWETYQEFY